MIPLDFHPEPSRSVHYFMPCDLGERDAGSQPLGPGAPLWLTWDQDFGEARRRWDRLDSAERLHRRRLELCERTERGGVDRDNDGPAGPRPAIVPLTWRERRAEEFDDQRQPVALVPPERQQHASAVEILRVGAGMTLAVQQDPGRQ